MGVKNICRGICDPKYMYDHLFHKPKKMAYILYPPTDYVRALEEMLDLSMREVREILTAPNFNDDGKANYQIMKLKLQVHDKLENRLKGVVSKKIEAVSYTHLRAHETGRNLVCRLLLEKKK